MKLLEHFKELSLHSKNLKDLKIFILQLAVQGKLTANWRAENSNTEVASKLLERIYIEKKRLVENKIFKAKYDTDFFEPLIDRPSIPKTWVYVTVGNICELLTGATPSRNKSSYFGGDIKWLVSGDIHLGYISDCDGRITEEGMDKSNCKILPMNSVMMALNGQGKTRATVALLKTEATCNQSLLAMKPFLDDENLSEYIYYLLKGKYYQIRDITGQHQRRGLNMTLVSQLPIALPPLEEQKAIVEVVNTLFAEVEQLESRTKERIQLKESFVVSALNKLTEAENTQEEWNFLQQHFSSFFTEKKNIKSLRETILQLAVQGKLTAKWRANNPNIEPASELLKRIEAEKQQLIAEKKIKKEKPLPPIVEDDIPYELPERWVWCRLGNSGYTQTGSTPPKKQPNYYGNFIPFLGPADISNHWMKYPEEGLSEEGIAVGRLIAKNSLMMVCIGGSIGKCNINTVDVSCNQQINTVTPILSEANYIKSCCQSQYFQNEVLTRSTGSATPIINKGKWEKIIIPIAPLQEQKAIVEKVNSLMSLCDELEQQIETSQTQIEQLMQSCLKEVFEQT